MNEVWRLDACAQAELVRKRELAPAELVEAAIARIEKLSPQVVSDQVDAVLLKRRVG